MNQAVTQKAVRSDDTKVTMTVASNHILQGRAVTCHLLSLLTHSEYYSDIAERSPTARTQVQP
jgi:hypothetical protein